MNQLTLVSLNGKFLADSREVAEMTDKQHFHLLRDIDGYAKVLTESNFGLSDFFIESTYQDGTGRTLKCYLLTKKGCDMVANKMIGEKGILFTATYVTKFEEMEIQINKPLYVLPQTFSEALRLLANSEEEKQQLLLENIHKDELLEKQKPLVTFAETCMVSDKNLLIREVAKLASKNSVLIGQQGLYNKLRSWGMVLKERNEPTQRAMEMGLFEVKQGAYQNPTKTGTYNTITVTPKGQLYIVNRLKQAN